MNLSELRSSAATEHKSQLATGTLTIWLRRVSSRVAGFGEQAQRTIAVPCLDMPVSSFGLGGGGGEASMLSKRYRVWEEDLFVGEGVDRVAVHVGRGDEVEYRQNDASGVPTGEPVVATVVETSTAMGGRCVLLECQVDRGSSEAGS